MNLLALLDHLGAASAPEPVAVSTDAPATAAATTGRRALLHRAARAGGRALAAAVPLAAALPAAAGTLTETVSDSLRLQLTLADLQAALYGRGLGTSGLVPGAVRPGLERILRLQQQQTAFLRDLFRASGAAVPAVPAFDFSGSQQGRGPVLFAGVFTTFAGFLALAQPLADAAARLYLGQLPALSGNAPLLGAALRRQAVEARQAAYLRTLRRGTGTLPKSWPSPTDPAALAALAFVQAGETNDLQVVPGATTGARYINFYALFTGNPVQTTALTEAFDEPLPSEQATALLALFQ